MVAVRNERSAVACAAVAVLVAMTLVASVPKNDTASTSHVKNASAVDHRQNLVPLSVTVRVVDAQSEQPIPSFRYKVSASTDNVSADNDERWQTPTDASGKFMVDVKAPCELHVYAQAPDYLRGYGHGSDSFVILADAVQQDVVLRLHRGITCRGKVIDGETGAPVANARVSPVIFRPPLFTADRDRAVLTHIDGTFQLRGVDPSLRVIVHHDEYLDGGEFGAIEEESATQPSNQTASRQVDRMITIKLVRGEVFRGQIVTSQGHPVPDVKVYDGAGKQVTSDPEGRFVLSSPHKWWSGGDSYELTFKRSGYVKQRLYPKAAPSDLFRVTLEELSRVRGRVISEDGQPIAGFRVITGPGDNPPDFQCEEAVVSDTEGVFSLPTEHKGQNWIGVRARGFAPWDRVIDINSTSDLQIRLSKGATVDGYIERPRGVSGEVTLKLIPQRQDGDANIVSGTPSRTIATETAVLSPEGTFRFENVRPDRYRLDIRGSEITPIIRNTIVSEKGLTVSALKLQGTGTIVGRVFDEETGKPCPFADGSWLHSANDSSNYSPFKADQDGWFRIANVPIGTVRILIPFAITADVIGGHVREANVVNGETTQVRFFEPGDQHQLKIVFVIGDGSARAVGRGTGRDATRKVQNVTDRSPTFNLRLEPTAPLTSSYPEADWKRSDEISMPSAKLRDVSPGRYRLIISDWAGSIGFAEPLKAIEVLKPPHSSVVHVHLGGGCVTGKIRLTGEDSGSVEVMAISTDGKTPHVTVTDENGNFCLRYLSRGNYLIYAHSRKEGWAHLPTVAVDEDSVDVGEFDLEPGVTLSGGVTIADGAVIPDRIKVSHTSGFYINTFDFKGFDGEEYAFERLWPGRWKVQLLHDEKVLSSVDIEVTRSGANRQNLSSLRR